jgi:hypothetical protein
MAFSGKVRFGMVTPAMQFIHGYYDNKSIVDSTRFYLNGYALLMRKD